MYVKCGCPTKNLMGIGMSTLFGVKLIASATSTCRRPNTLILMAESPIPSAI